MEVENQVSSFEQSKKLRELGIAQVSFFAWIDEGQLLSRHSANLDLMSIATNFTAAFTVAELGMMIPTGYDTMRITTTDGEKWQAYDNSGDDFPTDESYDTEAIARAEIVIQAIRDKILTIDEINKKLHP